MSLLFLEIGLHAERRLGVVRQHEIVSGSVLRDASCAKIQTATFPPCAHNSTVGDAGPVRDLVRAGASPAASVWIASVCIVVKGDYLIGSCGPAVCQVLPFSRHGALGHAHQARCLTSQEPQCDDLEDH